MIRRNKNGQVSENKSRSKEGWERGKGAPKKGNPSYKPEIRNGKKVYVVRDRNEKNSILGQLYKKMKKINF